MSAPNAFADLIPTPATQTPPENSFADLIPKEQTNSFADLIPKQPDQSNSAFDPAMWLKVQGMKRGTKEHPSENYLTLTHIGSQFGFLGVHGFETTGHDPNGAHPTGDAVDFRTRDKSWEDGNQFIAKMRKMGLTVIDERKKPGQPHIHVQVPRGGMFKGDFTPFPPPPEKPFTYDPTGIYDVAGQAMEHAAKVPTTSPNDIRYSTPEDAAMQLAQQRKAEYIKHPERLGKTAEQVAKEPIESFYSPSDIEAVKRSREPFKLNPGFYSGTGEPGRNLEPGKAWVGTDPNFAPADIQTAPSPSQVFQKAINEGLYAVGIPVGSPSYPGLTALAEAPNQFLNPLSIEEFAGNLVSKPGETLQGMAESVQNITKPGASLDERIGGIFTLAMVTGGLHGAVEGAGAFGKAVKSGDLGLAGKVLTDSGVHPDLAEKFVEKAWNEKQIEDLTNQRIEVQARTVTKTGKPKTNVNPKDEALLNTLDSQIQALKPSPVSETALNAQAPQIATTSTAETHPLVQGKVFYHGRLVPGEPVSTTGVYTSGIHFSPEPAMASDYAFGAAGFEPGTLPSDAHLAKLSAKGLSPRVYRASLNIRDPAIIRGGDPAVWNADGTFKSDLLDGHDGLIVLSGDGLPDEVIPKNTDQISWIGGKGKETAPSAPANNVSRETPVLQSAIIPGAKEFIEQDVVPSIESGIEGAKQIASDIKQGLNPAGIDATSKVTAGAIRERSAEMHINTARIQASLDSARRSFDKMPEPDQFDFIHKMESGAKQKTPELDVVAKALRTGLDDRAHQVQALGTGKLKTFIQDYFPHIWEKPKQNIVQAVFGKRPMQGPASFLKKRTIPTTADGLAAGLKPVTTNPVELTLLKIREMDRYLMAHRVLGELKDNKIAKFVRAGKAAPDGYTAIKDRIGTVYEGRTAQGSLAIRGQYHLPDAAAKVFNNYLSPGLSGVKAYDWARVSGNVLNQAQLGMSAFHLGFTAMDAVTSKAALSLELASRGKFGKAAAEAVKVPTAAFETYFKGDKLLKAIYKNDPSMAQYVDALQKAGGRIKMDNFYSTGAIEGLKNALKKHNYIGAGVRAPFAVIEAVARPVMEHAVPRMKLGVFFDLARMELERLGPNATEAAKRDVLGRVWDSVDNRMGQMTYDNLFWDKTAKDLAMVSVRSVGWNLGTIRELGGAALDTATVLKRIKQGDPWLTHRMAYAAALPVTTALVGSIVNYLYTGKGPDSLKDMFYPRTGQKNLDGTDERMQLPTYMKEVYPVASALAHGNVSRAVQHVGDAATAKVHPLLSASIQMMRNKDYYGDEIRHGGDPIVKQLLAEAGFAGSQFLPFSVRNIQKTQEQTGKTNLAPLIGITPAPRNLSKSDALLKAQEIMSNKMSDAPKTSAERAKMDAKNALVRDSGDIPDNELGKRALQAGLTKAQARNLIKKVNEPRLVYLAQQMSIDEAWSVYEEGTQAEKKELLPVIQRKVHNLVGDSDRQGSDPKRGRDFYNAHRELFKH